MSTLDKHEPELQLQPREWTGGVHRVRGLRHLGRPMRVAAWIDSSGNLLTAAIVEGHGPSVLLELLEDLLGETPPESRPERITVWPSAAKAFRRLQYPAVSFERDGFLSVVVEDQADFGNIPGDLPIRRAAPPGKVSH